MKDENKTREQLIKELGEGILSAISDGVDIVSYNYRILYANDNLKKIVGKNKLVGELCYEGFLNRRVPCKRCPMRRAIKSGRTETEEIRQPNNRIVELSSSPLKLPSGEMAAIEIIKDITEHKKAEEALRISEQKYRTMIEQSNDMIWTLDTKGHFTFFNKRSEEISGYRFVDWRDRSFTSLIVKKDLPLVIDVFHKVLNRESSHYEVRVKKKDGGIFVLSVNTAPILKAGKIVGTVSFGSDVTEYSKAEEALRESEKRFRDIAENSLEWIWEVDSKGKYIYTSPVVEKVLGYTPEEILKKHFYELFHPEDREELKSAAFKMFAKRQPFRKFINRNVHKNGRVVWFSTSGVPMLDEKGKLAGYRGADIDITERRKVDETLKESEKNMRKFSRKVLSVREQDKKRFANALHDEVGSMAIALGSSLSIAEEEIRDNNLQDALKSIRRAKSKLKKTVQDLKNIAVDLRPASLDAVGLTSALREYFSDITKQTKTMIDFSADIDEERIDSDAATVLYRVVQESLTNAIRHARTGKMVVKLYADNNNNNIELNIHNDGKGFDIEKALRKSRGLGLRGMMESVESLNGTFVIESAPKRGTEISVTLPNIKNRKS